jgi:hypothetical protein
MRRIAHLERAAIDVHVGGSVDAIEGDEAGIDVELADPGDGIGRRVGEAAAAEIKVHRVQRLPCDIAVDRAAADV